jgi:hypothetical protein
MKKFALVLFTALLLTSCASMKTGDAQLVQVRTNQPGATCDFSNGISSGSVVTPGAINVVRSKADLVITCVLPGYGKGTKTVQPGANWWTAANVANFGIGYGYDLYKGTAWQYPEVADITLIPASATFDGGFMMKVGSSGVIPAPAVSAPAVPVAPVQVYGDMPAPAAQYGTVPASVQQQPVQQPQTQEQFMQQMMIERNQIMQNAEQPQE